MPCFYSRAFQHAFCGWPDCVILSSFRISCVSPLRRGRCAYWATCSCDTRHFSSVLTCTDAPDGLGISAKAFEHVYQKDARQQHWFCTSVACSSALVSRRLHFAMLEKFHLPQPFLRRFEGLVGTAEILALA